MAVGKAVVAIDIFDKPSTCRMAWDRLLTGVVMDALEAEPTEGPAEAADVQRLLARVLDAPWQPTPAVGEGEEYRTAADQETHASALLFHGAMVHGSVMVAG